MDDIHAGLLAPHTMTASLQTWSAISSVCLRCSGSRHCVLIPTLQTHYCCLLNQGKHLRRPASKMLTSISLVETWGAECFVCPDYFFVLLLQPGWQIQTIIYLFDLSHNHKSPKPHWHETYGIMNNSISIFQCTSALTLPCCLRPLLNNM